MPEERSVRRRTADACFQPVSFGSLTGASATCSRTQSYSAVDASPTANLADMAKRDRREVFSRLVALIAHRLKWDYQLDQRCGSWTATILEQQRELRMLPESGTLRNHAAEVFAEAYAEAVKQAAAETGLDRLTFPGIAVGCGQDPA